MLADPGAVKALLLRMETEYDRKVGWDGMPILVMMCAPSPFQYHPAAFPMPDHAWQMGVPEALLQVGIVMGEQAEAAQVVAWRQTSMKLLPVGFAVVTEGYMRKMTTEQLEDRRTGREKRAIADIPGSVEVRNVTAVDNRGRTYCATHIRGQKPTVDFWELGDPCQLTGRVPSALRLLTIALFAGQPPDRQQLGVLAGERTRILADPDHYAPCAQQGSHP